MIRGGPSDKMALDNILSHFVPTEVICRIFSKYLSIQEVSNFDVAICNHKKRPRYLEYIGSLACVWLGNKENKLSSDGISWLRIRNMQIRDLNCDTLPDNIVVLIAGFGICLQWLNIDQQHVSDVSMMKIVKSCRNLKHLSIFGCSDITVLSMIMIAECCNKLVDLNIGIYIYIYRERESVVIN
jgi:hypothetical protein